MHLWEEKSQHLRKELIFFNEFYFFIFFISCSSKMVNPMQSQCGRRVSKAELAALEPTVSAPGLWAVCHLLMSSQGEAGP